MADKVKDPFRVILSTHRVTFVHIKQPAAFKDVDGNDGASASFYDCTFLIPYGHPDIDKIKKVIASAYAANKESVFKGMPLSSPKMWNPLRDGAEWLEEHPEATEYEGHMFLKAKSKSQPAVFDEDGQDLIDLDEVYSGAYCRADIKVYSFNKKSKGHGFWLNSLKKMKDGEPLGGFRASADDYDDEEDNSDINDLM